ncbi:MAG: hypothetical protein DRO98_06740 [Archaeoglobales archaeon]|nr:MAG: hypothetical protein DRO98_06740 [Archaeoglobales archaeon]
MSRPIFGRTLEELLEKTERECEQRGMVKEKGPLLKTLSDLVKDYGYSPKQIGVFIPIRIGSKEFEPDIVVYKDEQRHSPYIVIETKAPRKEGLSQAKSYADVIRASFAMWTDGHDTEVCDLSSNEIISTIPHAFQPRGSLIYGNGVGISPKPIRDVNELRLIFGRLHDVIRDIEKKALERAFKIVSRLIYTKIYSEKNTPTKRFYPFQAGFAEKVPDVAQRIRKLYSVARKREPNIFPEDIGVSHDLTLFRVAKILGPVSLKDTDLDIKGEAYQYFLDVVFRGALGQYFTPREIVRAMVEMVDPTENMKIIDPACGTGGFLLYSLFHVKKKLKEQYDIVSVREKLLEFAYYQLYGVEVEDDIAQAAISSMILCDDAHSHIIVADALSPWEDLRKHGLEPESFDVVLTNPPLGLYEQRREILNQFEVGRSRSRQLSQVLFVERGVEFLKPGGLMVTIMSEDALERDEDFIRYLKENTFIRAIISLPREAFIPYGANSKTNILVIQKPGAEVPPTDEIFMAEAKFVGYDTSGEHIEKNDLPLIVDKWCKFEREHRYLEVVRYG